MVNPYGVPSRIKGKINPEYRRRYERSQYQKHHERELKRFERQRRAKGIPPRKSAGSNRYGVPAGLSDGRPNPEYYKRRYRQNKEDMSAKFSQWYQANRKYDNMMTKKWGGKNKDRRSEIDRRHRYKRRGLNTKIVWGKRFLGSHLHHLTPTVAAYIPENLHNSIRHNIWTGKNVDKINVAAMEFYERGSIT